VWRRNDIDICSQWLEGLRPALLFGRWWFIRLVVVDVAGVGGFNLLIPLPIVCINVIFSFFRFLPDTTPKNFDRLSVTGKS